MHRVFHTKVESLINAVFHNAVVYHYTYTGVLLYYTILYYTILYYTILYYTILYYTVVV